MNRSSDQTNTPLSLAGIFKEPRKSSALALAFRAALVVHVFVVDHPSLWLANLPKRGKLILDVLPVVLRGPSRVERASF